jgi:2-C-methyl-D-erythritol 4-phosphate cytidylyltransferase
MKKFAVIAAGGSGTRMGSSVPKQFLQVKGKAILWYTVKAFVTAFEDIQLIVVTPAEHLEMAKAVCSEFSNVTFVTGGETRFHSVKNGLSFVEKGSIVFVHDAVRCLVSPVLISQCYNQAKEKGSAIPAISVNDSIRMVDGSSNKVVERSKVRIIQTPQTFLSDILLEAFNLNYREAFTDEATVVEASGKDVHLIEGEQTNIKITRPIDILIAEKILEERSSLQKS